MKNFFKNSEIVLTNTWTPGDITYLPFWWAIRQRFVNEISNVLQHYWFDERHFHDIIPEEEVEKMNNNIMDISKKIYNIWSVNWSKRNYFLAPTHEIPISNILNKYIQHSGQLPMHFFHVGQAFRKQYKAPFPFNLSKRNTYIECYWLYHTKEEVEKRLWNILEINEKILRDILQLPYIISQRPLITNNPVSKKTIGLDVITKLDKTLHAWMIYSHEDVFTDVYNVKYYANNLSEKNNVQSLHFWFTDNLLMATIMESFNESWYLELPENLIPYHITGLDNCPRSILERFSKETNHRFRIKNNINQWSLKKQIKVADLQWIMIQIRWEDEEWNYIYKINQEYWWKVWNAEEITDNIDKKLKIRTAKKNDKNNEILKNKVNYTSTIKWIQGLIQSWNIATTHLKKTDTNILNLEKQLKWCEILWFYNENNIWDCILTKEKTDDMIYVSKRI